MLTVVTDEDATAVDAASTLDEIVRDGARRMLAAALEAEVASYIEARVGELDEHGHRLVVRNGHAEPRTITTAAGGIEIEAPRVEDRRVDPDTGERLRFRSAIVAPWCRKSPKVAEVLPLMYLHGMSTGDFAPALGEFFGSAAGLSASVVLEEEGEVERSPMERMRRPTVPVEPVPALSIEQLRRCWPLADLRTSVVPLPWARAPAAIPVVAAVALGAAMSLGEAVVGWTAGRPRR